MPLLLLKDRRSDNSDHHQGLAAPGAAPWAPGASQDTLSISRAQAELATRRGSRQYVLPHFCRSVTPTDFTPELQEGIPGIPLEMVRAEALGLVWLGGSPVPGLGSCLGPVSALGCCQSCA